MRKPKLLNVESALIVVVKDGSEYGRASVTLKSGGPYPESVARIEMQANKLDSHTYEKPDNARDHSDPRWDFGYNGAAYGPFYGAHLEMSRDIDAGACGAGGQAKLRRVIKLLDKVNATSEECNVFYKFPHCELSQWVETLERLGVSVTLELYSRGGKAFSHPIDLAEFREQYTTSKYFRSLEKAAQAESTN